jgi:5-methylcytosine-specific restriction enzyme subunit McrC
MMVLDTKWKLGTRDEFVRPSESDAYQMLGYGSRVFGQGGVVALVYPAHDGFESPRGPFTYGSSLELWMLPYSLEQERLRVPRVASFAELFDISVSRRQ